MSGRPALDAFQHDAIDFIEAARGRVIYADPMGARKTATTLSALSALPGADHVLCVVPGAVVGHWAREAARFYPRLPVFIGRGSKAQRHARLDEAGRGPGLYITTYGSMVQDIDALTGRFDAVVFDEGHRLKGRRTAVALASNRLARSRYLILASGTPLLNHPHELWQYLHMIDPQGYTSFWAWAQAHFFIELKQFKGQRQATRIIHGFRPGMEESLRNDLMGVLLQRELVELFDADEHPWIVEPDHVEVPVTLAPSERKLYDKLVKDLWGRTPNNLLINAGNKLVVSGRLRQLTSDWGTLDPDLAFGSKIAATTELVSDLVRREPVIVFAMFKPTVNRLVESLMARKLRAVAWTGDTPPLEKEDILIRWAEGKVDVIVGTIASMGEGVDGLQFRSSQVVLLDRDWRAKINDQAIGRARRSGQSKRVTVYHVFADGTIDVAVHEANLRKENFDRTLRGKDVAALLYGRSTNIEIEIEEV